MKQCCWYSFAFKRSILYKLDLWNSRKLFASVAVLYDVWHKRLGHPSNEILRKIASCDVVEGIQLDGRLNDLKCDICCESKQTKIHFRKSISRAKGLLELVHSDVCSVECSSFSGLKYFKMIFPRRCLYISSSRSLMFWTNLLNLKFLPKNKLVNRLDAE